MAKIIIEVDTAQDQRLMELLERLIQLLEETKDNE